MLGCFLSSTVGFGLRIFQVGAIVVGCQVGQRRWTWWPAVWSVTLAIPLWDWQQ